MNASADEPVLKLGVAGLGGAFAQMLPTLQAHPRVGIVGAADPRPEARQKFAADTGADTHESVESLCADASVDAVYVASPHSLHCLHATMAAEAGKHVIVEKPMAPSLDECDAMIDAADRNGVCLIVGHTHSSNAPIMRAREIIRSGDLGAVAMINNWAYSDYLYRPRLRAELDTAEGGGAIFNQAPHQVDIVRLLGGGLVRSVRAMAWRLDPDRPTEGCYLAHLQFDGGAAASIAFSGHGGFDSDALHGWIGEAGKEKPQEYPASRVIGAVDQQDEMRRARRYGAAGWDPGVWGGSLDRCHHPHFGVTIVTCERGDLRPTSDGVIVYRRDGPQETRVPPVRAFPDKFGVIDELLDAIDGCRAPLHDGRWGRATLEVCLAILDSAKESREIALSGQVTDASGRTSIRPRCPGAPSAQPNTRPGRSSKEIR